MRAVARIEGAALGSALALASIGCASGAQKCPGASTTPAVPSFSEAQVDPIDAIEVEDAGYADRRRIVILVRYRGGSEPHRFALFLRQQWGQEPGFDAGLLQHVAPRGAGREIQRCWLDFDFGDRWIANMEISSDRRRSVPLRLNEKGYDRVGGPPWLR